MADKPIQGDEHLAYMIDNFAQAVIDLGKEQMQAKDGQEPSVDHIQTGLHAELVRKDLEAAIQAHVDEAVREAKRKTLRRVLRHEKDVWGASRNKSWIEAELKKLTTQSKSKEAEQ